MSIFLPTKHVEGIRDSFKCSLNEGEQKGQGRAMADHVGDYVDEPKATPRIEELAWIF